MAIHTSIRLGSVLDRVGGGARWRHLPGRLGAIYSCPRCGTESVAWAHRIGPAGALLDGVECARPQCGYSGAARLVGWSREPDPVPLVILSPHPEKVG